MTAVVKVKVEQLYDHQKLVVARKSGDNLSPLGELTEVDQELSITVYDPTEVVILEKDK